VTTETAVTTPTRTLTHLADIVRSLAQRPDEWMPRVQLRCGERWFECVERDPDHDVWLISWLPGQGTGFHDHGGSAGAFAVVLGTLEEHRAGADPLTVHGGEVRAFGSQYAHDVRNASAAPAVSIHAYSPPLTRMTKYELAGEQLVQLGVEDDTRAQAPTVEMGNADRRGIAARQRRRSIAEVLDVARVGLSRLLPHEAQHAVGSGAVLVDIRPAAQRAAEGEIPTALVIERNVLEWRFDPQSEARLAAATDYDLQIIVVCSEGYTSSLAAAALQDLGLSRATDVIGGFHAWRAAGLPMTDPTAGAATPPPTENIDGLPPA
jgi:rhodanese-related sulfurtransferase/mannose-6-phosphate isomerase-like protein (cupin superfamily)